MRQSAVDTPADYSLTPIHNRIRKEWQEWCEAHHSKAELRAARKSGIGLMHHTVVAHGLPPNWVAVGTYEWSETLDVTLVSHPEGGWVVLLSMSGDDLIRCVTKVFSAHTDVLALYEDVCAHEEASHSTPSAQGWTQWVHDFIVPLYDPTDPVEAAEQMVAAFGGPITLIPHRSRSVNRSLNRST